MKKKTSIKKHPSAVLLGIEKISFGTDCSIFPNVTIRADGNKITIGNRVNIQDNAVIHSGHEGEEIIIGNNVTIGHSAIIHNARIGNRVIVGMGAIVMTGAVIKDDCVIGAGSVVTQKTTIPEKTMWVGNPAKKLKDCSAEHLNDILNNAQNYVKYSEQLEKIDY